ncbi:MAG: hypothetical protein IT281_04390 [Ignavibacteria bacterium]|nr:hypothetical protein [Ignavibacteria bacterium]MCC7158760.1 hypothetical protein [Ignavibacteria bacterium]
MKNKKHFAVLALMLIICAAALAGLVKNSSSEGKVKNTGFFSGQFTGAEKDFKGASEFYFTDEKDGRVWHVMNLYTSPVNNDSDKLNSSYYCFSKDSVTVLNRYLFKGEEKVNNSVTEKLNR